MSPTIIGTTIFVAFYKVNVGDLSLIFSMLYLRKVTFFSSHFSPNDILYAFLRNIKNIPSYK